MKHQDDFEHLQQIRNGHPGPYAILVDRYKSMVYTISLKILRDAEDAQDAAQETFLKAYQQIHQFQGKSKFSTWLYTIAYRTAISKLKEPKLRTLSMNEEIRENYTNTSATQHEQMQMEQQEVYVKLAINKLPPTEALLVTLYYLNENTVKEIHEITGLAITNIKIKLFRARKRLERELQFLVDVEPKVAE